MHRIVANCFKAIAYAMIFIIVWDVGFYIWRVNSFNNRMESIMVSMQEVVSKNNYLPQSEHDMFKVIFTTLRSDFDAQGDFIESMWLNYGEESSYKPTISVSDKGNIARYRLQYPASYGDVMIIQAKVTVKAPYWGFVGGSTSADSLQRRYTTIDLDYTYIVPCLKYATTT